MINTIACLFLLYPVHSVCQVVRHNHLPQYLRTGNFSEHFANALSCISNQSMLAYAKSFSVGVYSEQKFMIPELKSVTTIIAFPVMSGGVGVITRYFGYPGYNESTLSVAYGRDLGKIIIGVQVNCYLVRVSGYESVLQPGFEVSSIWKLSPRLNAGFQLANPLRNSRTENTIDKPSMFFNSSIGYEVSKIVYCSIGIVKEENHPPYISASFEYHFNSKYFIRCGINTDANAFVVGTGLQWKNFRVDITSSYHLQLGFTPGLLFIYSPKEKDL